MRAGSGALETWSDDARCILLPPWIRARAVYEVAVSGQTGLASTWEAAEDRRSEEGKRRH
jgi:hypothetical protein